MNIANRDTGNFVHFWWYFRLNIYISTDIELQHRENMKFRLTFHIKLVSSFKILIFGQFMVQNLSNLVRMPIMSIIRCLGCPTVLLFF